MTIKGIGLAQSQTKMAGRPNKQNGVEIMAFFVFIGCFILALALAAFLTENFTNL
jgi:hypothetical protein